MQVSSVSGVEEEKKLDPKDKKELEELRETKRAEEKELKRRKKEVAVPIMPGDYQLHVFIQKTKDLDIKEGKKRQVLIEVEVDGQVVKTCKKPDQTNTSITCWRESVFVELAGKSVKELENLCVTVKILRDSKLSNTQIGSTVIDVLTLYKSPDHAL
jgi:hypothetical protein